MSPIHISTQQDCSEAPGWKSSWVQLLRMPESVYCDKGAKRGANHGLKSSIFRIDETSRGMRGLILRNNKTAFQQVECRFAGNPLYQPGIWTPSKTPSRDEARRRGLYQPGIWTPSKTAQGSKRLPTQLYQPGIWTPSRTLTSMSCHGYRLYQPGIWHSSRTRKISRAWYFSLYLLERVYCDKGAKTATKVRNGVRTTD